MSAIRVLQFFILVIFISICNVNAAQHLNQSYPRFTKWLLKQGITEEYSGESLKNLKDLLNQKVKKYDDESDEKEFLDKAISLISSNEKGAVKEQEYIVALRILYTVMVEERGEKSLKTRDRVTEQLDISKTLRNLISKTDVLKITVPPLSEEQNPIGIEQAKKEADYLINCQGNYVSRKDLSKMNSIEVGDLDINRKHPVWMSYHDFVSERKTKRDRFSELERWYEKRIEKSVLKKNGKKVNYKAKEAKRVVFFEDLKPTGTSPKAKVRDAYNQPWKIKFSAEIQTEPFVSRLLVAAGGKITDLVYANVLGRRGTTLILTGEGEEGNLCNPKNLEDFLKCFKGKPFKINLKPFVHSSGVITNENIDSILKYLPKDADGIKYKNKKELIGKSYITFKESSLKLLSKKGVTRGNATSYSHLGAAKDRVARGMLLFNMWVGNGDTKDANNKSYLVADDFPLNPQDEGNATSSYLETEHDLGLTLGGIIGGGGDISRFPSGKHFVWRTTHGVHFNQFTAFVPKAFKMATYSDLRWMGKFIGEITIDELRKIAEETNWPSFMQEVLIYRLADRRDQILRVLNEKIFFQKMGVKRPNIKYKLDGHDKEFVKLLKQFPILKNKVNDFCKVKHTKGEACTDQVVKHGKVSRKSFIVKTLEKEIYPVGLSWRRPRFSALVPIAKKFPL